MEFLTILQICFIAGIFVLNLIFILLPLKIIPRSPTRLTTPKSVRIISLCNCFSGGVFLGVCYLQLTPYVNNKLEETFKKLDIKANYCLPATQCMIMLGFLLVLFIEQIVKVVRGSDDAHTGPFPGEVVNLQSLTPNGWPVNSDDGSTGSDDSDDEVNAGEENRMIKPKTKKRSPHKFHKTEWDGTTDSHYDAMARSHSHGGHGHSHLGDLAMGDKFDLRCFLLLGALSLHSLFEGLAVGLQDNLSKLINLFIGVALHEILVAFAVGINLAQQKLKLSTVVKLSFFFSLIIPVGMGLGLVIGTSQDSLAGQITSAVIQGIAGGTFLYVIFMEILPTEINRSKDHLLKVFFILVGYGVIGALSFSMDRN